MDLRKLSKITDSFIKRTKQFRFSKLKLRDSYNDVPKLYAWLSKNGDSIKEIDTDVYRTKYNGYFILSEFAPEVYFIKTETYEQLPKNLKAAVNDLEAEDLAVQVTPGDYQVQDIEPFVVALLK